MEQENKFRQPLIILGVTIVILYAISFINLDYEIPVINFKLKSIDLLSDIKEVSATEPQLLNQLDQKVNPTLLKIKRTSLDNMNIFSSAFSFFENLPDNTDYLSLTIFQGRKTPITGNINQLSYSFNALNR